MLHRLLDQVGELQGTGWADPRRHLSLDWGFRFVLQSTWVHRGGVVLGCRGPDGQLAAVAAVKVYRSRARDGCGEYRAAWRTGSMLLATLRTRPCASLPPTGV